MGLLAAEGPGLVIEDFLLIRQAIGPAHVDLDMDHWADRQAELFDSRNIEPWRTSCWAHTHPAGMNQPSGVDEKTMVDSFGGWDLAIMLIMTRDGQFYARLDVDHDFTGGQRQRLSLPCSVEIDWASPGFEAITGEVIAEWEAEFVECIQETSNNWLIFENDPPDKRKRGSKRNGHGVQSGSLPEEFIPREEVNDYVAICRNQGLDPDDPENFEDFFGFESSAEVLFGD